MEFRFTAQRERGGGHGEAIKPDEAMGSPELPFSLRLLPSGLWWGNPGICRQKIALLLHCRHGAVGVWERRAVEPCVEAHTNESKELPEILPQFTVSLRAATLVKSVKP